MIADALSRNKFDCMIIEEQTEDWIKEYVMPDKKDHESTNGRRRIIEDKSYFFLIKLHERLGDIVITRLIITSIVYFEVKKIRKRAS